MSAAVMAPLSEFCNTTRTQACAAHIQEEHAVTTTHEVVFCAVPQTCGFFVAFVAPSNFHAMRQTLQLCDFLAVLDEACVVGHLVIQGAGSEVALVRHPIHS